MSAWAGWAPHAWAVGAWAEQTQVEHLRPVLNRRPELRRQHDTDDALLVLGLI